MHDKWGFLPALLLTVLVLGGCSTGGGHHGSRGSVSDAAAKAADENESGRESGRTRTETDQWDSDSSRDTEKYTDDYENDFENYENYGYDDDDNIGPALIGGLLSGLFNGGQDTQKAYRDADFNPDNNLLVWLSRGNPAGDTIKNMSTVSVMHSSYRNKRWRRHVGLFYGWGKKGPQPDVQGGIDRIAEYGLEVGAREYLTPRHTFVGVYVIYGLRIGGLYWSYTEAIPVSGDSGAETVTSDQAFIITPYLGLGTSLVQAKPFHIGASLTWGMRFVGDRTLEEFDNDLFRDTGELRLNLETSLFF